MFTEEPHHYYGHVQDVREVNLVKYMVGLPLALLGILFLIAAGLGPLVLLVWFLWEAKENVNTP